MPHYTQFHIALLFSFCTLFIQSCGTPIPDGPITAPAANASPINQISIDKNGCGPVSLMNAYKFGSSSWQTAYQTLGNPPNASDQDKFNHLVNKYGIRISKHNHMIRWDKRIGISSLDLCDMANDYQRARVPNLSSLKTKSLFLAGGETPEHLLQRTHRQLRDTLLQGFPPILSIKRFAKRSIGKIRVWKQIHGHFVVLYEIPGKIPSHATSFNIKYIDPWGGKIKTGTIKIPETSFFAIDSTNKTNLNFQKSPTLIVDFPQSNLGYHLVRKREPNVTVITSAIHP